MFAKVSTWLKPTPFAEQEQEQIAKTLNVLLILTLVGGLALTIVRLTIGGVMTTVYAGLTLVLCSALLLWLVRRGNYLIASYATPILVLVALSYAVAQDNGLNDSGLPSLAIPIVLGALLLGRRGTVLLTILANVAVLLMGIGQMSGWPQNSLGGPVEPIDIIIASLAFTFIGLAVYVMVGNLSHSLRQARETNRELQTLSITLENKVADRVKDLSQAASVSATFSQASDLSRLLQNAANVIQQQFNLYYAQIYLLNKDGSILQLRAGSGNVGQELVRRGHRLVVGTGSVNGSAALEQRPILVPDTSVNPIFRSNALLPLTRSEIAVPLLSGERLLGVLNLQSEAVDELNENRLPAFAMLGNQLAIAIENVTLLAETQAARTQMESYARGVARQGWETYLNAVDRPQFLGFHYNSEQGVRPLAEPLGSAAEAERNLAQTPIELVGQTIGAIQIEADAEHHWTEEDLEFIQTVAQKVGQQVEIIRSLDEAAYYRQEAEGALRRLTQEAWQEYQSDMEEADGYIYDSVEVRPLTPRAAAESGLLLRQTLRVGDEVIGELAVGKEGEYDPAEALEITAVVAGQLSQHLETLRLSATTEKALSNAQRRSNELAIFNTLVNQLSQVSSLQESMQIVVEQMAAALQVRQARIALLNPQKNNLIIVAEVFDENVSPSALNTVLPIKGNPLTEQILSERRTAVVSDAQNSPLTAPIHHLMRQQGIHSLIVMPILIKDEVVGTLGIDLLEAEEVITESQLQLGEAILQQAANAIEKARLFEQTQARAEEMEAINQIAQIVARQIDQEQLLNTVYEQVRRIMPVDAYFVALYDSQSQLVEYPLIYDEGQIYREAPAPLSPTTRVYEVLQTGEGLLLNRSPEEIAAVEAGRRTNQTGYFGRASASMLFVPLRIGQQIIGVLSVQSYRLDAYEQRDMTLLAGIANHVAVALDNARLLAESQQRVQEGQILQSLATSINTAVDAESVLRTAAREIGRALGLQTYVYLQEPAAADSFENEALSGTNGRGNGRSPQ